MSYIYDDVLEHYGVKRRSGRYPWGSGENPYQRSGDFCARVETLRKQGKSDVEIAKEMGYSSSTDFRTAYSIANNERKKLNIDRAKSLAEDGLGASEIGRKMGINESTVRSWLNSNTEANVKAAERTAETLKKALEDKPILDVGAGVEKELGISSNKLKEALMRLEIEGYQVMGVSLPQPNDPSKRTTVRVLCGPGVTQRYIYQHPGEIRSVADYHSRDGGISWDKREYPSSISSKRIQVNYGDQGGAQKDGVIEIRPGVKDLDLGKSHYAQVRILVDGTHYLKGMAMYADDLPDGVDIRFNTNKKSGTPMLGDDGVLKRIKSDPDNPFGAYIKANGQSFYDDPKGKYTNPETGKKQSLSAINKLKEEGDWDTMSRTLSSQFLSKQPTELIKKQLRLTYSDYEAQFDEIMSYSQPTVRKKLLQDFADSCDSASIHLQAAALPRQTSRVILPLTTLKDNEVYAPYLKDGTRVALIRYPHAGTFEIPVLKVNNQEPNAKRILGNAVDAIGINSKVAERLSGADFDGDSVTVIPVNNRVRIKSTPALKGLEGFDPKIEYSTVGKTGVKLMTKRQTQKEMGIVSNLITDMTLRGAPESDIVKAVKHSMVVIDAEKHKLDYKQSEKDNDIPLLKKKWQIHYDENGDIVKYGGASTLISRRKQGVRVPERKGQARVDKATGEYIYKESGRTYLNKKGEVVKAETSVPLISVTKDMRMLSSGTPQEALYADYGNKMKALANKARKTAANMETPKKNPGAAKKYAKEVQELKDALDEAAKDAPKQRRALGIANEVIKAKIQDNPELADKDNKKELAKIKRAALDDARAQVGASSKESRINITEAQWEAMQNYAVSATTVERILRYSDQERVRELALPKTSTSLSPAKQNKLKAMQASGYTIAEIAESLGISTSTVSKYINA